MTEIISNLPKVTTNVPVGFEANDFEAILMDEESPRGEKDRIQKEIERIESELLWYQRFAVPEEKQRKSDIQKSKQELEERLSQRRAEENALAFEALLEFTKVRTALVRALTDLPEAPEAIQ